MSTPGTKIEFKFRPSKALLNKLLEEKREMYNPKTPAQKKAEFEERMAKRERRERKG